MSTLKVDTLVAADGSSPATLTKQEAAKMFAQIDGTGTVGVDISLNVSSISDVGTGEPHPNFTNNFSSANSYVCTGATQPETDWNDTVTWNTGGGTSRINLFTGSDGTLIDLDPVGVALFGDLA